MDGFMREAMEAGALGMSTGLEFNPGREATTAELVRLNAIAGEYDGIYTSHVRNRDSGILHAIAEFLEVARAGGIRAEISHLNVRHNTGAPDRGWERAVEMMAAAREEGMDVLADTTPFLDGLGPALRDPAALGRRRRHRGGRSPSCATRRRGSGCARSATATGGSSTRASGIACACRRASSTRTGTASRSPRSPTSRKADPWDCYFDVLADAGDDVREHPRRRQALHRRAHGGDDLAPALLPRRRHVHGHARRPARRRPPPSARLLRPRPLPHPPRAGERARSASRRRSAR